jgi:hypothetical protein
MDEGMNEINEMNECGTHGGMILTGENRRT